MAVKLGLLVHGHNRGDNPSRYRHMLAHSQQVKELTIIEGQLGVSELVSCRRASNGDPVDVSRTWVLDMLLPTRLSKSNFYTDSVRVLDGVYL